MIGKANISGWFPKIAYKDLKYKMSESNKHTKYEASAKRKQVLSIRTSKGDSEEEWNAIVAWLQKLGDGKAKDGLYKLAQKNRVI